ncbi:PAS domain-containing protein [Geobacter sp. AOG1]|uniref:PAS domain-containing protein n=1 Tax=Geobacter sp. AOG1 TaxID=1566346 RepID=UPI001CC7E328|nr:PAS domain S-box protein [Geobacter sp. AOG1]GFE57029.1 histidine kinase [Geobacter sp. AOG1]
MKLGERLRGVVDNLSGAGEIQRLVAENDLLRERERLAYVYVRSKVNQLLRVMGTLPLRAEELNDSTLLELDPIGIIADAFAQVLDHLNDTNDKLKLANDEIQAILTAANVGILVLDAEMKVQAFNPKLREMFLPAGIDVIGSACSEVLCGQDIPPADCTFAKVMASKIGLQRQEWALKGCHYDVAAAPIKNRFGEITHAVLVYNEVTDRKRMMESLQESEEMFRTLLENSRDMVQGVTPDGTFLYVNRAWRQALGYGEDEIDRLTIHDIIHPDCREHCLGFFQALLSTGKGGEIEAVFVSRDGTTLPVKGNVSCNFRDGKPLVTCGIFHRADVGQSCL